MDLNVSSIVEKECDSCMEPFGEDTVVEIFVVVPCNVWVNLSHTQFPHECEPRPYSPIEEVLADYREGKMVILVDRKAAPVVIPKVPLKTGSRDLHVPIDTGRASIINTPR